MPTVHNSVNKDDKLINQNAIVESGDILNTDIVEIPANVSTNDDIVQTDLTKARIFFEELT